MADDKKNIPDAGKMDEPPKPGKIEPVKVDPPVQGSAHPSTPRRLPHPQPSRQAFQDQDLLFPGRHFEPFPHLFRSPSFFSLSTLLGAYQNGELLTNPN